MKFSEKWGDSVESAVALAVADLGLEREQVTVTILEEPSRGFFGIGSKLAKVRVEEKAPKFEPKTAKSEETRIEPKLERSEKPVRAAVSEDTAEKAPARPRKEREPRQKNERRGRSRKARGAESYAYGEANVLGERPADLVEQEEHPVKTFLIDMFREMGLDVSIRVSTNAECVYVDVDGPDSGTVIGKRGQTLDAIQYLASLVENKGENGYTRVVIDAEGYRQKREKTLEKLANRLADKAARTGRAVRLEPMNPYERKVIHTALQKRPEVTTKSEGDEPYRRVIIEPTK